MKLSINEKVAAMVIEMKAMQGTTINAVLYSAIEQYYNKLKYEQQVQYGQSTSISDKEKANQNSTSNYT